MHTNLQQDEEAKDYIDAFLQQAKRDINEGKHDTTFESKFDNK